MDKDIKFPVLVAVYGTLRKGYGNHSLLENSNFIGEFKTPEEYNMYSLGYYPALALEGKTSITTEIYQVLNEETFSRLDMLEGYPTFYNRKEIDTEWGKAWIYYIDDKAYMSGSVLIESGDWNEFTSLNKKEEIEND